MKYYVLGFVAVAAAILFVPSALAMEHVVNGNFTDTQGDNEAGPPWVMNEDPFDGYGAIDVGRFQKSGFANAEGNNPPNNGGVWFRSFNGNNGTNPGVFVDLLVTQTIGTLTNGNSYDFSADVKLETNHTSDSITATLDGDLNVDLKAGVPQDGGWHTVTGSFTYTGGPGLLSLTFLNGSDALVNPQSAFVDNVSIVPEPTTALLLSAGLVGLAVRRRR